MAKKEYKTLPFSVKQVDLRGSQFEGFSAGIGNRDSADDIIQPGAFDRTIAERVAARKVKFLDGHDPTSTRNLWGVITDAEEQAAPDGDPPQDPTHLIWTEFQVTQNDADAQAALGKIEEGILDALSIGFFALDVEYQIREELLEDEEDPEDIDPQMAWLFGLADRLIHEVAWWETSAVVWGANAAALTIPGTVKDIMVDAHRATSSGRGITDEEAFETLKRLKGLNLAARENPEAMRAFDYDADGLSKALDPFIDCVNGTCSLTDAGKAASYLFDGVRDALSEAEDEGKTIVIPSKNEEVKDDVSDTERKDGCSCKDAPEDSVNVDDLGDAPEIDLKEMVNDLVWDALADLAPSAVEQGSAEVDETKDAEPEGDAPDGLDERQDECGEEKNEDAGTERTSAADSDKHLPTESELEDMLAPLATLDLE